MKTDQPLLSIVVTSYTMERFKDICELLDSIKSQTLLTQRQGLSPQSKVLSPKSPDIGHRTSDNLSAAAKESVVKGKIEEGRKIRETH